MDAPPLRRAPLSSMSPNATVPSPESHGTPVKRVLQARTFSPDGEVTLPPTPSPNKARFNASPSPAKQPSDLATDLARSKLYLRMQHTCRTPEEGSGPKQPASQKTPAEMPADSAITTPAAEALGNLGSSGGSSAKSTKSTPGWDGTPARRLREEASKLRTMTRLNSPALASSRRSLECKNAVGDELARTRSQLAAAEAKVRELETPNGSHGQNRRLSSASDLLNFDDASTSTPNPARIGSNIPAVSARRSEAWQPNQTADTSARPVTVTVRVVNDTLAPARQVTLQPSSSRAGSVLAQLKKSVHEFAGGKVIVRATAARGWERVSKADQLSEGEQCYLLFDPSEKDRLPSIMLDQARVAAELRDCEVLGTELGRSAACTSDRDGSHCSDQVREVEHLRSTVSEQQSEIERLRSELEASCAALKDEVSARKAAETRMFEAFEELAERHHQRSELERMKAVSPMVLQQQDTLAPYSSVPKTKAISHQRQWPGESTGHGVDLAVFAEELNDANERASYFQARVAQLEVEAAAGAPPGGETMSTSRTSRPSNVKAMFSSAAGWVALGNLWSISGGDHEVGRALTPKRRSPTRAAQTPGGAKCDYMQV